MVKQRTSISGKSAKTEILPVDTTTHSEAGSYSSGEFDVDDYSSFFVETGSGLSRFTPEVRLRIAALGDAIWCLQRTPRKRKNKGSDSGGASANRTSAQAWINGDCVSEPTFSFKEVCEIIGLDPQATRKAVFALVKKRKFDIRELVFWLK